MSKQTFDLDIPDYLSIKHSQYVHALEQAALTDPASYYKLRESVIDALGDLMETNFKTYYDMLTLGIVPKKAGGNVEIKVGATNRTPSVAKQKASAFALRAVENLNEILEEAVEMVLPASIQEISKMRLTKMQDAVAPKI